MKVPAVRFSVLAPPRATTIEECAAFVDPIFDAIIPHLSVLAEVLREQTRRGQYRRARRYRAEVEEARRLIRLLSEEPLALEKARRAKTTKQLAKVLPASLFRAELVDSQAFAHRIALIALRCAVELDDIEPRGAPTTDGVWAKLPRVEELAVAFPSLELSQETMALVARSKDTLVALTIRGETYKVIANRFVSPLGLSGSLAMGSVSMEICRLHDEPPTDHLERLRAMVEIAKQVAPRLPIEQHGQSLRDRWGALFGLTREGQVHWAIDTALVPFPSSGKEARWCMLIRGNDGELRLGILSDATFALVELLSWSGPPAPNRGGGLRQADAALDVVFEKLPGLAVAFWSGGPAPKEVAATWLASMKKLLEPDWWPMLELAAPEFFGWIQSG